MPKRKKQAKFYFIGKNIPKTDLKRNAPIKGVPNTT